ncbi:MAG: hypothetical protein A2020_10725 [Lentisphaerae bacterium GWF2_45_14]|nr:MAG: hypothetical protein A2020_10725 [Lentisphaerae bacterium GWF2_45_14]
MFSLSRKQLADLRGRDHASSRIIISFMENPSDFLVTVLFGNLMVNTLFFCISATMLSRLGGHGHFIEIAAGLLVLFSVIIFGEITPKAIGVAFPLTISTLAAIPLKIWQSAVFPITQCLVLFAEKFEPDIGREREPLINSEEFSMLLGISETEGLLDRDTSSMIQDIMELNRLKAKYIMTPRTEMLAIPHESSIDDALDFAKKNRFFFLLTYKGERENISGMASAKEICLAPDRKGTVSDFVRPVSFVPETIKVSQLLEKMTDQKLPLVIVVDEFGGVSGMVTYKDVVEEFSGNLEDDFTDSKEASVAHIGKNKYRIPGCLSIMSWKDFFGNSLPKLEERALETTTVGGFVTLLLGRIPQRGDTVSFMNLRFTVEKMGKRRIETVIVMVKVSGGAEG